MTKATSLPFKSGHKPEMIEISDPVMGTLEFPKLCSISYNEEVEALRLLKSIDKDGSNMPSINLGLATIALRRLEPAWTEEQSKGLPVTLIKSCAEYFMNERNGWVAPDPVAVGKLLSGKNTKPKSEKATANSIGDSPAPSPKTDDGSTTTSETNS